MKCIKIIEDKIKELDDDIDLQVTEVRRIISVIHGDENIDYEFQTKKLKELVLNKKLENVKSINFRKGYKNCFYIDVEFIGFIYTFAIEEGTNYQGNRIYYFNNYYKSYNEELHCKKMDRLKRGLFKILKYKLADNIFDIIKSRENLFLNFNNGYTDNGILRYELWDSQPSDYRSSIHGEIEYKDDYISAIDSLDEINKTDLTIQDFSNDKLNWEEGSVTWREYKL